MTEQRRIHHGRIAFFKRHGYCGEVVNVESYGGGQRWACPKCDIRRNEYGMMVVSWTNSKAPTYCTRKRG